MESSYTHLMSFLLYLNIHQYCRQYQTLSETWGDLREGKRGTQPEVDDDDDDDDKHISFKTTIGSG